MRDEMDSVKPSRVGKSEALPTKSNHFSTEWWATKIRCSLYLA